MYLRVGGDTDCDEKMTSDCGDLQAAVQSQASFCVPQSRTIIYVTHLDKWHEFWYIWGRSMTTEQKKRLLKAKIAVALQNELGRVPKEEEINQVFLMARVLYKAVLGLHYKREEQKKSGQLAIF